jgi:glucosamine-6-phosphate deaminase
MGVGTILEAKRVVMLALGEHKRGIVREAIEGPVTTEVSASFLQNHPAAVVVLDAAAAGDLTRVNAPWLLGPLMLQDRAWDESLERQAVVWLAKEAKKPILKLEESDYARHGLEELLAHGGSAYDINLRVFRRLQNTITGWPGGRPGPGDEKPLARRILVFSPHPDDDVISLGGTVARLTKQGHEVHVAYQVSGANAVSASFMSRQLDFVRDAAGVLGEVAALACSDAMSADDRRTLAAAVRRAEARSAASVTGVVPERCHFLNLPFYERAGRSVGDDDILVLRTILADVQPEQIYAAGDLADPHGTHRICLELLTAAIEAEAKEGAAWVSGCDFWLYRGAWGDWRAHEIDRAIPLSPAEVLLKRQAILRHQSQKDETPFLGGDEREFWQRAEDRTREAAELYRSLGWAEYAALETFARWHPVGGG